jgi:ribosomal protein S18 acetylase RimI-like enzyme
MPIVYRDSQDVDLDQLAALLTSAEMGDRAADRQRLAQQVRGSRYVVSAWDGAVLVGFARAISDGATNAYISTVAVLPDYRRQGIGGKMIRRLLDGKDGLTFALHSRTEAKAFYKRCGFVETADMFRRLRKY